MTIDCNLKITLVTYSMRMILILQSTRLVEHELKVVSVCLARAPSDHNFTKVYFYTKKDIFNTFVIAKSSTFNPFFSVDYIQI